MRVALVYPPAADATQPYSSLAALAGFLRARGNHEVVLHDANVEYVLRTLTRERIAACRIDEDPLASARLKAPFVLDDIDAAVASLRLHETFSDLARLDHARRVIQDAREILAGDESDSFPAFFDEVTLPALRDAAPDAIGISITYRRQIAAAIALGSLIRERMRVPVIFGGQIASLWHGVVSDVPQLFDWCDYLIAFEGETALDALLSALERGTPLDGVPNLAYRRDGVVHATPLHIEDIDALPAPDYRGLPLDRYLAPEPVLLLNTTRGCYWSKCEFCSVSPSMRHCFRMRRPELVLHDIATLQARHAARCISFGDDCIPPRMLKALARGLRERQLGVSWQCEVRFEPQLDAPLLGEIRDAGCVNLIFGLESWAPRVLASMNKGVRPATIRRILDDCRRHDLAFNLQFFFGFPGETAEEARRTMEFAIAEMHGAATLSFGTFRLQRGSGVAQRPEAFGIRIASDQEPLAVELAFEPVPAHAEEMRRELAEIVRARTGFQSLPLGIDAHTLLYLHHSGVAAMARAYYAPTATVTADETLARRSGQTITQTSDSKIVLYDHELDRAVELSPLAVWLLDQLDRPRSARQLARRLARTTGEPAATLLPTITGIAAALVERRMVRIGTGAAAFLNTPL